MNDLKGYDIEDLTPGMSASMSKEVSDADIVKFSEVSGDVNPVHLDDAYAATTPFGGRIAHGMLSASLISAVIANRLPGPGTVYLDQRLSFKAPVRPGDVVEAVVTVKEVQDKGPRGSANRMSCRGYGGGFGGRAGKGWLVGATERKAARVKTGGGILDGQ